VRVPLEILTLEAPPTRAAQTGSAELRQILAMGAFAGAFLAAVGSVVTWNDGVATAPRAPVAAAAHTAAGATVLPARAQLVLPTPPPSPVASPAARRAAVAAAISALRPPVPARQPSVVTGSYQQALINQDRAAAGLGPLTWSSCLAGVAQQQASRMASQGSISHTDGISEDLGCGLGGFAGENLGYWTGGVNDTQLNSMFMASSEHRANILGNFRYVGTYWVTAPNGTAYLAVEFAS